MVSELEIAKVPFYVTCLVLRPWQIFIFLHDFNNWIFLLIDQLLIYLLPSPCNILTCKEKPLVLSYDCLYTEVSFYLNFLTVTPQYHSREQSLLYLHPFFCKCGGLILTSNLRWVDLGRLPGTHQDALAILSPNKTGERKYNKKLMAWDNDKEITKELQSWAN